MNASNIMDALTDISPNKIQAALERMGYIHVPQKRARQMGRKTKVLLLAAALALLLAACGYTVGRAINSPEQAWEVAQREIDLMKDMGILTESLRLPDEPNFIMENAENEENLPDLNWYGRIFKHSYTVMATDDEYLFHFFVDTMSGKITKLSIEARAEENDDKIVLDDFSDGSMEVSMNYYDIVPDNITLDAFCSLLSDYWGFSGYKLAETEDKERHYDTAVPDGSKQLTDYANSSYITVYFDGDQQGVPMFIELSSNKHPYGVYFTVGTNHSVG